MDWDALVTNPLHTIFGVGATLTLNDSSGTVIVLTDAIDNTKGVTVGDSIETQTILPAVDIKRSDLGDAADSELRDSTLVFDASPTVTWTVRNHKDMQTPAGADTGEVRLFLRKS